MLDETKLVPEWRNIRKKVYDRNPADPEFKILGEMTIGEFVDLHPDYTVGVSTIFEPPMIDLYGKGYWMSVPADELIESERRMYEAMVIPDGSAAVWNGKEWVMTEE